MFMAFDEENNLFIFTYFYRESLLAEFDYVLKPNKNFYEQKKMKAMIYINKGHNVLYVFFCQVSM